MIGEMCECVFLSNAERFHPSASLSIEWTRSYTTKAIEGNDSNHSRPGSEKTVGGKEE